MTTAEAKCPACDSTNCVPWTKRTWVLPPLGKEFSYLSCNNCGTAFSNPWPTPEELSEYYEKNFDFRWYERRLFWKNIQSRHRWQRMERLFKMRGISQGHLLDIGCGHGMFVRAASQTGWNSIGLDYPSKATAYAKNHLRLNIIEDEFISAYKSGRLVESQFDFVTAWHCLEHSSNPLEFLSIVRKILKPGGKMLLAVPNSESFGMKFAREDWLWHQEPFVHVVHFNSRSLSQIITRASMKTLSTWSRDTWDANRACDTGRISRIIWRHFTRRIRINPMIEANAQEVHRLIFYLIGCRNHWLFQRECKEMDGSELLLLAERSS